MSKLRWAVVVVVLLAAVFPAASDQLYPGETHIRYAIYRENFDNDVPGSNPSRWIDTSADNSMDQVDWFRVYDLNGERVFGTYETATNMHSHYAFPLRIHQWHDYTYVGRLLITDPDGGIGVTLYSGYTRSDDYYRLRRYAAEPDFHFAAHPHVEGNQCNLVSTGVVPDAGVWYVFKVRANNTVSSDGSDLGTLLRAKVWREGEAEPDWQATCLDESQHRVYGTFGVWTMGPGGKFVDDLVIGRF